MNFLNPTVLFHFQLLYHVQEPIDIQLPQSLSVKPTQQVAIPPHFYDSKHSHKTLSLSLANLREQVTSSPNSSIYTHLYRISPSTSYQRQHSPQIKLPHPLESNSKVVSIAMEFFVSE